MKISHETGEIESLECKSCGKETPLESCWATLHENGRRIVHTCADPECLAKAKTLPEATP